MIKWIEMETARDYSDLDLVVVGQEKIDRFNEDTVEQAALDWLHGLGYTVKPGPDNAPGEPTTERESYNQVVLLGWLRGVSGEVNRLR